MTQAESSPLIEPVVLARIGTTPQKLPFEASPAVREELAARFGLMELKAFSGQATLRRRRDTGWIELKGTLRADLVQECVATLEPVEAVVQAEIDELFDDSRKSDGIEVDLDPVGEDPEPLEGETLDVGDVVTQILSLAIDPYPRAPGAEGAVEVNDDGGERRETEAEKEPSPFAALALLKDRAVKNR